MDRLPGRRPLPRRGCGRPRGSGIIWWRPWRTISWQQNYRLTLAHVKAGGALPAQPGEVIVQGEDPGVWIAEQRATWQTLVPAQQFLLETVGFDPEEGGPLRPVTRSQDDRWATNLAAAQQFHAREGHLRVPRKHVEVILVGKGADGGREEVVKLGAFLDNTRRRAGKLSAERRADLDALSMRW
jgi:hypothetical protein